MKKISVYYTTGPDENKILQSVSNIFGYSDFITREFSALDIKFIHSVSYLNITEKD